MLAEKWRASNALSSAIFITAKTGRRPTLAASILCLPTLSMIGRLSFGEPDIIVIILVWPPVCLIQFLFLVFFNDNALER